MSHTDVSLRSILIAAQCDVAAFVDAAVAQHGDSPPMSEMRGRYFGLGSEDLPADLPWRHVVVNEALSRCTDAKALGPASPAAPATYSPAALDLAAAGASLPSLVVPALEVPDLEPTGWWSDRFDTCMRWLLNHMHTRDCNTLGRIEVALNTAVKVLYDNRRVRVKTGNNARPVPFVGYFRRMYLEACEAGGGMEVDGDEGQEEGEGEMYDARDKPDEKRLALKCANQALARFSSRELQDGAALSAAARAELAAYALLHAPFSLMEYASTYIATVDESDFTSEHLAGVIEELGPEEDLGLVEQETYPWVMAKFVGMQALEEPSGIERLSGIGSLYDADATRKVLEVDLCAQGLQLDPKPAVGADEPAPKYVPVCAFSEGLRDFYIRNLFAVEAAESNSEASRFARPGGPPVLPPALVTYIRGPTRAVVRDSADGWDCEEAFGVTVGEDVETGLPVSFHMNDEDGQQVLAVREAELASWMQLVSFATFKARKGGARARASGSGAAPMDADSQQAGDGAAGEGSDEDRPSGPPRKRVNTARRDGDDDMQDAGSDGPGPDGDDDGDEEQLDEGEVEGITPSAALKTACAAAQAGAPPAPSRGALRGTRSISVSAAGCHCPGVVRRLLRHCGAVAETDDVVPLVLSLLRDSVQEVTTAARGLAGDGNPICASHLAAALTRRSRGPPLSVLGYGRMYRGVWSCSIRKTLAQIHPDVTLSWEALTVLNDVMSHLLLWLAGDDQQQGAGEAGGPPGCTVAFTLKGCDLDEPGDAAIPSVPLVTTLTPPASTAAPSGSSAPAPPAVGTLLDIARCSLKTDGAPLPAPLPDAVLDVVGSETGIIALRDRDAPVTLVAADWRADGRRVVSLDAVVRRIKSLDSSLSESGEKEVAQHLKKYRSASLTGAERKLGGLIRQYNTSRGMLGMPIEMIAHLLLTTKKVVLTDEALVAMAAFADYTLAELLELSGNELSDDPDRLYPNTESSETIGPEHVLAAATGDKALAALLTLLGDSGAEHGRTGAAEEGAGGEDEPREPHAKPEARGLEALWADIPRFHLLGAGALVMTRKARRVDDGSGGSLLPDHSTFWRLWRQQTYQDSGSDGDATLLLNGRCYQVVRDSDGDGYYGGGGKGEDEDGVKALVARPWLDDDDALPGDLQHEALGELTRVERAELEVDLRSEGAVLSLRQAACGLDPIIRHRRVGPLTRPREFFAVVFDQVEAIGRQRLTIEALQLLHAAGEQLVVNEILAAVERAQCECQKGVTVLKSHHFSPASA